MVGVPMLRAVQELLIAACVGAYVEEKGTACSAHSHRRNHTLATERPMTLTAPLMASAS